MCLNPGAFWVFFGLRLSVCLNPGAFKCFFGLRLSVCLNPGAFRVFFGSRLSVCLNPGSFQNPGSFPLRLLAATPIFGPFSVHNFASNFASKTLLESRSYSNKANPSMLTIFFQSCPLLPI